MLSQDCPTCLYIRKDCPTLFNVCKFCLKIGLSMSANAVPKTFLLCMSKDWSTLSYVCKCCPKTVLPCLSKDCPVLNPYACKCCPKAVLPCLSKDCLTLSLCLQMLSQDCLTWPVLFQQPSRKGELTFNIKRIEVIDIRTSRRKCLKPFKTQSRGMG